MIAISSTCWPSFGNTSLTSMPDLPILLNLNGDGKASPSKPGSVLSAYFANSGFGSHVSTCDGPPSAKMWITALALAGKCGSFGASGLASAAARGAPEASAPRPRIDARLIAPKPMPVRSRNWRRVKIESSREDECSRVYLEEGEQESAFMEVLSGKRTRYEPRRSRKVALDCRLSLIKRGRSD